MTEIPSYQLNAKSLPERTADAISSMIHLENYRPGSKLPNELKLAERFEVSRSTVRQAIKILAERKLVYVERGSGTYVAELNVDLSDPLGLSTVYDKSKLMKDLLEFRLLIEPRAALLAAQNASEKDGKLLLQICAECEELIRNGQNYVQKDIEFHQAIANCCGNAVLHNMIPYIFQMQLLNLTITARRRNQLTAEEHRRIAEAITAHRGADAYDAMQYHLQMILRNYQ